jgi:hypothetical protein
VSSQHKAPLAAFAVLTIACIVVVVSTLRAEGVPGFLQRPGQTLVAGLHIQPSPRHVVEAPSQVAAGAKGELQAARTAVAEVATSVGQAPTTQHQTSRHHEHAATVPAVSTLAGTTGSAQTVDPIAGVPAPAAAASAAPVRQDETGEAHQPAGHGPVGPGLAHVGHVGHGVGLVGHLADAAPYGDGKGWGASKQKDESHGHGARGPAVGHHHRVKQHRTAGARGGWSSDTATAWSVGGQQARGRGNAWGDGWRNGWSNGSSHGRGTGWAKSHGHGRH